MKKIQVLDQITIDKIAAGEVVERPASVVKELVENAIDAKATAVTVEIQEGGIAMIRITDNGDGMGAEDVPSAFLRHSTSKIRSIDDLTHIGTLGFRGEALSSIAAVSQVELTTKQREEVFGTRYVIEGGTEKKLEEAGTPDGTTFLVRQLFYNVPARRKFLKTPVTETSHVNDLLMRLALSHPEISFRFLSNGSEKLRTSGKGRVKDVIYSLYGRDVTANLIEVAFERDGMRMEGYLGKPVISRGNRNFENYFINGRYIRSAMLSKAIEDAYKDFMMQHKFPFVVLYFVLPSEEIDVNVHPAKMEIRFHRQQDVYQFVYEGVRRFLTDTELIPDMHFPEQRNSTKTTENQQKSGISDAKNVNKYVENVDNFTKNDEIRDEEYFIRKMKERVASYHNRNSAAEVRDPASVFRPEIQTDRIKEAVAYRKTAEKALRTEEQNAANAEFAWEMRQNQPQKTERTPLNFKNSLQKTERDLEKSIDNHEKTERALKKDPVKQLNLFEEKFLDPQRSAQYQIIGQVFDTYWLVQFQENLYIIDQHAAHERVLYERTLRDLKSREYTSQILSPPIVLSLTMQEAEMLRTYMERFTRLGFEIEPFGGDEYAVYAVPDNLFGIARKELLLEMLDDMADGITTGMTPELIDEKIASMSCKAAVKGNQRLSAQEVHALIGELLELENPYHCPHGRPTIIAMSKRELEKKFKRIV